MGKNILYIAPVVDFGNVGFVGIRKKVLGQCEAFVRLGYCPTLVLYEKGNVIIRYHDGKVQSIPYPKIVWFIGNYTPILRKYLLNQGGRYDLVYVRKAISETPFTLSATKLLRKHSDSLIVEIPTYPYDDETRGIFKRYSLTKKLKVFPFYVFGMFLSDKIYRYRLKKHIDCFAVITDLPECEEAFGAPAVKMSNGIDVENIQMRKRIPDGALSLLAVASISYWHGYDRVMQGMHEYYYSGGTQEIIFNIVGEGAVSAELKKLAEDLGLSDRVVFHGIKIGEELDELFHGADIGIGTFGGHRLNRDTDSDLKICEYCARALPYITSMKDNDIPDSFPWKLLMPNDESPIDIHEVLKFAEVCYNNRDRLSEMRDFAKENLSWDVHLKVTLDFLDAIGEKDDK